MLRGQGTVFQWARRLFEGESPMHKNPANGVDFRTDGDRNAMASTSAPSPRYSPRSMPPSRRPASDARLLPTLRAIAETARISVPTVFDAFAGTLDRDVADGRLAHWASQLIRAAATNIVVRGREHRAPDGAYVIMSNHQSNFDVPVLYEALGPKMRMVAKAELFTIPIFGKAMLAAGFVRVDRAQRAEAVKSLETAKTLLSEGRSLFIAPEGTRSRDGSLGPFKKGGFHLAASAALPILPVTVDGTLEILPRGALRTVRGKSVVVTIHPPVAPSALGDKAALLATMAAVRSAIQSALPAL